MTTKGTVRLLSGADIALSMRRVWPGSRKSHPREVLADVKNVETTFTTGIQVVCVSSPRDLPHLTPDATGPVRSGVSCCLGTSTMWGRAGQRALNLLLGQRARNLLLGQRARNLLFLSQVAMSSAEMSITPSLLITPSQYPLNTLSTPSQHQPSQLDQIHQPQILDSP